MAGLAIDDLWQRRRFVSRFAAILLAALFAYQLALVGVVMPMFSDRFGASRTTGRTIDRAISQAPAPALAIDALDTNEFFYVYHPIRLLDLRDAAAVAPPAWLLVLPDNLRWIEEQNPALAVSQLVKPNSSAGVVAARIDPRP